MFSSSPSGQLENLINTLPSEFNMILHDVNEIISSLKDGIIKLKSKNLTSADYNEVWVLYEKAVYSQIRVSLFRYKINKIIEIILIDKDLVDLHHSVFVFDGVDLGYLKETVYDKAFMPLVVRSCAAAHCALLRSCAAQHKLES